MVAPRNHYGLSLFFWTKAPRNEAFRYGTTGNPLGCGDMVTGDNVTTLVNRNVSLFRPCD